MSGKPWDEGNQTRVRSVGGRLYAGRLGQWLEVKVDACEYENWMFELGWVASPSAEDIDALDSNG